MDDDVIAAMARWPNVPAVCGWLSLDRRGRWRLHPLGDADQGGLGESISNPQILAFMDRNYVRDVTGRWYFQNGPQRVFVRIDVAPLALRATGQAAQLTTHTGQDVTQVAQWYADEAGRLYAQTEHGPGVVDDRDMAALLAAFQLADGRNVLDAPPDWLDVAEGDDGPDAAAMRSGAPLAIHTEPYGAAFLQPLAEADREQVLGFVAVPALDDKDGEPSMLAEGIGGEASQASRHQ